MIDAPETGASGFRAHFGRSGDPYAGADIALGRRFAVAMWALAALAVAVLNVFFPPTRTLGDVAGWSLTAAGYLVVIAVIAVVADKRRKIGFDFLYGTSFVGVLLIAMIQYAAGGRIAPYHEMFMFQVVGAALMHPPRRVLLFLGCVAAAAFAPVLYAPGTAEPGEIATELLLWTGLAVLMMVLMRTIRSQRLELQKEGAEARQLARVDALTGLGNRRAFDEALDSELARSRRADSPLSLIVADLNGFKEINDLHGHVRGDECLRQAALTLRATVRRPDLCFRWGGDEFSVMLTGADATVARALAVRLEKAVAAACKRPDGAPLTLTCGHAALEPSMNAADAVAQADATLLAMKARERAGAESAAAFN
jgi:diguanylate cyclase (GGDEF)-like protein